MFSSNQILEVSGELDIKQLEMALDFALKYSEKDKYIQRKDYRDCQLVYQIAGNKYCIGWMWSRLPKGWNEYPFDFDIKIVSYIIQQHLEKFSIGDNNFGDGSCYKGFLMKCVSHKHYNDCDIVEPNDCIIYFEPYTCFYAK